MYGMTKTKVFTVIGVVILIILWFALFHKDRSSISELYAQKWIIVTQKAELLQQDLEIRNQIDAINKEIAKIDSKLYSLINWTGFIQAWQPQELSPIQLLDNYISGTQTESVSQSQQ